MKKTIYSFLHTIYEINGHIFAAGCNLIWGIRDYIIPPKENAILFTAHPDDEVLFFDSFISDYKPYVVCLTLGGNLQRIIPFCRAVRHYGVRYRFFDMSPRDISRTALLSKRIRAILSKGNFTVCATHNSSGEYGHIMHRCVHECVKKEWGGALMTPVEEEEITKYPLSREKANKKMQVLKKYYAKELPTLDNYSEWICCEKILIEWDEN